MAAGYLLVDDEGRLSQPQGRVRSDRVRELFPTLRRAASKSATATIAAQLSCWRPLRRFGSTAFKVQLPFEKEAARQRRGLLVSLRISKQGVATAASQRAAPGKSCRQDNEPPVRVCLSFPSATKHARDLRSGVWLQPKEAASHAQPPCVRQRARAKGRSHGVSAPTIITTRENYLRLMRFGRLRTHDDGSQIYARPCVHAMPQKELAAVEATSMMPRA